MPRILVIRGGAIGDFVLTLPAIRLLRESFPDATLDILGYKHIIALAEGRYYAHATRSIEYASLAGFFAPNSRLAPDLVAYFSEFQQIVSYLYDPDLFFEENIRRCGVKHFLNASPMVEEEGHAAHQLARPLERLALFLEDPAASLFPDAADHAAAARFFHGITGPVAALHPGSGSDRKNWPLRHWQELGARLSARVPGVTLLLVGGEADENALTILRQAWRGLPILVARGLPLCHLAALLARCAVFAGHDSGVSHIAAAVGTPCTLIFGPTDPKVWAPANAQVRVIQAPDGVLEHLPPETVLNSLLSRLNS